MGSSAPIRTHAPCPVCGGSDCVTWFEKGRGFCHGGCGGKAIFTEDYVPDSEKTVKKRSFEGIRGLDPEVAKYYGISLHKTEDGEPVRYTFEYEGNTKYRGYSDKKIWFKEPGFKNNKLFGPPVNAGSSKRLYLTEGEFDAASLYQILGQTYPVLSVPSASIGSAFLKENHQFLDTFQEVVWAGDQDEAGLKAAEKLYLTLPTKFYYVPMTKHKDANAFLTAGDGDDLKWAALKPQRWAPDNFFCSDEAVLKALKEENPYEYTPTGITGLDDLVRGFVRGGLTFLKAPPGSGKTEIFRYIERSILENSDYTIGLLHMEEQKSTTYRGMATYELGLNVRTKDDAKSFEVSEEEVQQAAIKAAKGERTVVFEMRSGDEPEKVLSYVHLAATVYGVKYFFIDHVQRLAYLGGVDNATNILTKIGSNLANMCKELDIGVMLISHVNDDGRTKYAGSLEEEACMVIDLIRDKEAEDETERNTTRFKVTKNRPFSKLGEGGQVYYDPVTTILTDIPV